MLFDDAAGAGSDEVDKVLDVFGVGGIRGFGEGGADGGESVGGVELAGQQEAVGLAESLELGGSEAAALQADLVEAVGVVVALDAGERVGQDRSEERRVGKECRS